VTSSSLVSVVWIPGLFVLGVVLIVAVIAVAVKTMRRR